jgi:hypothetical protein
MSDSGTRRLPIKTPSFDTMCLNDGPGPGDAAAYITRRSGRVESLAIT